MRYTYEVYDTQSGDRIDTFTRFEELAPFIKETIFVKIFDNITSQQVAKLATRDHYEEWADKLARDSAWKPPLDKAVGKKDHINPSHYQAYLSMPDGFDTNIEQIELQWLETMMMSRFSDPARLIPALELQVRKYMDREGGKDPSLQEMQKALWYMKFLVAYLKNDCKPFKIQNIDTILNAKETTNKR